MEKFPASYLAALGVVRGSEECPAGIEPSICCLRLEIVEFISGNRPEGGQYLTPGPRTEGRCEAGPWLGERILEVGAPRTHLKVYSPTYRVRRPTDRDVAAVRNVVAK